MSDLYLLTHLCNNCVISGAHPTKRTSSATITILNLAIPTLKAATTSKDKLQKFTDHPYQLSSLNYRM